MCQGWSSTSEEGLVLLLVLLFFFNLPNWQVWHLFLGNFPEPLLSKGLSSISNPVLPPKKIPKEFIMKYKRGEINPVSALHQFAQMQRVQLDLKETVTTGKWKPCLLITGRGNLFLLKEHISGAELDYFLFSHNVRAR